MDLHAFHLLMKFIDGWMDEWMNWCFLHILWLRPVWCVCACATCCSSSRSCRVCYQFGLWAMSGPTVSDHLWSFNDDHVESVFFVTFYAFSFYYFFVLRFQIRSASRFQYIFLFIVVVVAIANLNCNHKYGFELQIKCLQMLSSRRKKRRRSRSSSDGRHASHTGWNRS